MIERSASICCSQQHRHGDWASTMADVISGNKIPDSSITHSAAEAVRKHESQMSFKHLVRVFVFSAMKGIRQNLFTNRGCTCSGFIQSVRLDQAARTIKRRWSTKSGQPLSTIAYACGYRDYTSFARAFRQRFCHAPGIHVQSDDVNPVRTLRPKGRVRPTTPPAQRPSFDSRCRWAAS